MSSCAVVIRPSAMRDGSIFSVPFAMAARISATFAISTSLLASVAAAKSCADAGDKWTLLRVGAFVLTAAAAQAALPASLPAAFVGEPAFCSDAGERFGVEESSFTAGPGGNLVL